MGTNEAENETMALAIKIGVKAAIEYIADEKKKARTSRYDRRLHNTRLLLKNYRSLKEHAQGAVFDGKRANAIDILDDLNSTFLDDGAYVDGIKKSQQRTAVVIKHIDEMLHFYRISCEQSDKPEDMRRYRVIRAMYIDEPRVSAAKIAEKEKIEHRTIYKDINAAIKPLSALIFGIDGLNIE